MEDKTTSFSKGITIQTNELNKYEGIIDQSFIKKLRSSVISMFTNIDSDSLNIRFLYTFITLIRFIQFLAPSFLIANDNVWKEDSSAYQTLMVLSILYEFVPKFGYEGYEEIIVYAFAGIQIAFFLFICISGMNYKKTARISEFSSVLIVIYMACFALTLPTVIVNFMGLLLSSMIAGIQPFDTKNCIALLFGAVSVYLYVALMTSCYNLTLTFRRCSFLTIESVFQNTLLISTMAVNFCLALQSKLNQNLQIALCSIAFIIYLSIGIKTIVSSTLVNATHQALIITGSFFSCISLVVCLITSHLKIELEEMFLLISIVVLVIIYIISSAIVKHLETKNILILDDYEATKEIKSIGKTSTFLRILPTGFNYCHPICLDLSIFTNAVHEWPGELIVWITFAKFAAIYPENINTLSFIVKSFATNKFKGIKADAIINCIVDILKVRETNLSPYLKQKIEKFKKVSTKTKNKLRNVWDLILQCNINEMDNAIHSTYLSATDNKQGIDHLIKMFPNNKFVARLYANFFFEIKADAENHAIWKEKFQRLQRGTLISEDQIQKLGLEAFSSLPIKLNNNGQMYDKGSFQQDEFTEDLLTEDNDGNLKKSLCSIIKKKKFKSIQFIIFSTILAFVFLMAIPSVAFIIHFPIYKEKIITPLDYIYSISYLRNILNMIAAFVVNILASNVENPATPGLPIMEKLAVPKDFKLTAFNNERDVIGMTNYVIQQVVGLSEMVCDFIEYEKGNEDLDKARSLLFENTINFTAHTANGTAVKILTSAETIVTKVALQASAITQLDKYTVDTFFSPAAMTAMNNNDEATISFNYALLLLNNFIMESDRFYQVEFIALCVVLCCLSGIVYMVIFGFQLKFLQNEKMEIFKTMTTLPKTVVSSISASFFQIKKDKFSSSQSSNDMASNDFNKQEENVIKTFNSISENSLNTSIFLIGLLVIILIATCVISFYFIASTYMSVSTTIIVSCPHINNLLGSCSYLFSIMAKLFKISISKCNPAFTKVVTSIDAEVESLKAKLTSQNKYFNSLRFGGKGDRDYPFIGMDTSLKSANAIMACADPYVPPKTMIQGGLCFDSEGIVYLTTAFIKKYVHSMDANHFVSPRSENLADVWQLGVIMQYEAFFYPSSRKIVDTILDDISKDAPRMHTAVAVCIIFSFISVVIIIYAAKEEEKYMRFALSIFLHVPPKTIYTSPRVLEIICGDKNNSLFDDATERDTDFYNNIINKLNDIVIIAGSDDDIILSANNAFENTFNTKRENIVGTKLRDFIENEHFEGATIEEIYVNTCNVVYDNNGNKVHISSRVLNVNGTRTLIGRNQTTRVMHQLLIDEEKKKSDTMLASILPASLVHRVQSGEKNISFAVQSASVLFLDIVEFTPWCGSNKADYVMKTLNIIFKELDALIATHKTLSKIKCIGDCYMAAGGIFDESNQPAIHAKEMVEFGIEAIKKIREIDQIYNEKLRIRVGINTGGPIIAGVLGTDKPTFEILGPTINIAQQMEHHGIPMIVHVSRPVYELIYGGPFSIKERGEIEVKNKKMFTYIVDPDPKP